MRKVVLFIAMSLDGYIADASGKVDWLTGHSAQQEDMDTYSDFIQDVDTVVMGWNTYHQIVTELSPSKWVYENLTSYVITHRKLPSQQRIVFTQESPCEVVRRQRQLPGKTIWICGGASIVKPLLAQGLIDEYRICVIPTILGAGIRLFAQTQKPIPLKLVRTQTGNGIIELVYTVRKEDKSLL
jgi:dihydrofolate reductase